MRYRYMLLFLLLIAQAGFTQVPYVNFENHPIHALDLSPNGNTLAVAHTADHRVQLFDVSEGHPVFAGHVVVGTDPVSVRFRNDGELWVVNHISDSISVVDVAQRTVKATLATLDEPFDLVFAGSPERAYVSCSQANTVQLFNPNNLTATLVNIPIEAEDPRALAVSPDGQTVYAAIFESGNATTVVAGATEQGLFPPNAARDASGPYGGTNPPPNDGNGFSPALNANLPVAPQVSMIVRRNNNNQWMDDNGGNWTPMVSGARANESGRIQGWDLPDRDLAVIDTATGNVSYRSGLMNLGMALAVHPITGQPTVVGTDATNEVRFEPNVNGTFVRVILAGPNTPPVDLNPHLDYQNSRASQPVRNLSLGDPRAIVWHTDGERGYVAGMGSNNLVAIDSQGTRSGNPLELGEGPVGLALSSDDTRLYVWNHFEATLSTVDTDSLVELDRLAVFNPLPDSIRRGRRIFYATHETSGLGQAACASCHVDGRSDRLAWDLGDPSGELKEFNQNCGTTLVAPCVDFHPLKGPMTTQTLQDIIGKEPFHWRGDRDGIEEFNGAFVSLLGDDTELSNEQMQDFEDFLATIAMPPNPFRNPDNSLSNSVPLEGHFTTGRFAMAGLPLGPGNAANGFNRFSIGRLDLLPQFNNAQADCISCHNIPTGASINAPNVDAGTGTVIGGAVFPEGPNGENHLGLVGVSTVGELTMKVPQLRTVYEKVGLDYRNPDSAAGFGFLHDGAVDTLANLVALQEFGVSSDQEVADVVAFLLSFSGSDLGTPNIQAELSLDAHASLGRQITLSGDLPTTPLIALVNLVEAGDLELIANSGSRNWLREADGRYQPDDDGPAIEQSEMLAQADPVTFKAVSIGLGERLALDRDGDGVPNGVEKIQGSNPADPNSKTFAPAQGLWYNPTRSGHGIDLQRAGDLLAGTWYTYEKDGTPTWYQAVGPFEEFQWTAELFRYVWNPDGGVDGESVGEMSFAFLDWQTAEFCWALNRGSQAASGCEPFQRFAFSADLTLRNYTGLWFDPNESGYGLSVDTLGNVRVAVIYFYDANRQPRWVIGQGDNALENNIDMLSFRGFCPDCQAIEAISEPGGQLGLSISQTDRTLLMELDVNYPGLIGSDWIRSAVNLVPLTDLVINLDQ